MNYILLVLAVLSAIHIFSYVKQTWKKSKLPAIGALIVAVLAIALPIFYMLRE